MANDSGARALRTNADGKQEQEQEGQTGQPANGQGSAPQPQAQPQPQASTSQQQAGQGNRSTQQSDGEKLAGGFANGVINDLQGDVVRGLVGNAVNYTFGTGQYNVGVDATGGMETAIEGNGSSFSNSTANAITSGATTIAIGLLAGQDLEQIGASYVAGQAAEWATKSIVGSVPGLSDSIASVANGAGAALNNTLSTFNVDIASGISFNPVSIGASVVGSFLLSELGVIDSKEAAVGSQIGAVVGQVLIPIPIIGSFIGQFFGAILGGLFGDDPDPRSAVFVNSSDDTLGVYGEGTSSVFGNFGFADTDNFDSDLAQGSKKFAEQVAVMDEQIVKALQMTPDQISVAKENLQNTNMRYDFGLEDTGWHPSQRILTDRYAAVMDAIDPRAGDMLRFSNPDTQGMGTVLQGAAQVAVFAQQVEANKDRLSPQQLAAADDRIQAVRDEHLDQFMEMVYNEDPKIGKPQEAYSGPTYETGFEPFSAAGNRVPEYLIAAQEDWTEKQENDAAEYKEEKRELQAEIIAETDPATVRRYDEFVEAMRTYTPHAYDHKGNISMIAQPPPVPPADVQAFQERLNAATPPGEVPLFVANPMVQVPVYGGKDNSIQGYELHSSVASARSQVTWSHAPTYDTKNGAYGLESSPSTTPDPSVAAQMQASYPSIAELMTPIHIPPEPEIPDSYSMAQGGNSQQYDRVRDTPLTAEELHAQQVAEAEAAATANYHYDSKGGGGYVPPQTEFYNSESNAPALQSGGGGYYDGKGFYIEPAAVQQPEVHHQAEPAHVEPPPAAYQEPEENAYANRWQIRYDRK